MLFNTSKNYIKKAEKIRLESKKYNYKNLTDEELKHKTIELKEKLETSLLDKIAPEAFAVVAEAIYRQEGITLHDNQYWAAWTLHQGDIAEQACGQGKTIAGIVAAYLEALDGKGVHIITVNEYLAQRDAEECSKIMERLGLTVGVSLSGQLQNKKKAAYDADITYTTNSEVGFDYLRDNMVFNINDKVQRSLNVALIDEADSVLIDEARTPLVISNQPSNDDGQYLEIDTFAKTLKPEDYEIDIEYKSIQLTEEGIKKAEQYFKMDNLYTEDNVGLLHLIGNALKANYVMKNEVDYMVENGEVFIIDPSTGRKMEGRQWNDGLHQAVQAKERVIIEPEAKTIATITYQNLFRLYNKLCGMTGTAKTEEEEFLATYNMRVIEIPTNEPIIREDKVDLVYGTKNDKYNALVKEVKRLHEEGRPVLIGTIAVETSEVISRRLEKEGLKHEVLNAKNHAREAEIIAKAGQKGVITVATNMAGRGTDIKLGEGVNELGGLAVLGSERHEARRIDNQLRGRAGRQGDKGSSQFFLSLEDDLIRRFGMENLQKQLASAFEVFDGEALQSPLVAKTVKSAQARIEGINFDARSNLSKYDDVVAKQREDYYHDRDIVLTEDIHSLTKSFVERVSNDKELWKEYEEKNINEEVERRMVLKIMDENWQKHIEYLSFLKETLKNKTYADTNIFGTYHEQATQAYDDFVEDSCKQIAEKIKNPDMGISIGTFVLEI